METVNVYEKLTKNHNRRSIFIEIVSRYGPMLVEL